MRHAAILLTCLTSGLCFAWNGHEVTEGDLKLFIQEMPEITAYNAPAPVLVDLENTGAERLEGTLAVRDMVDDSRVIGESRKPFSVEPGGKAQATFQVAFGTGCYSALYPVHVYADFQQARAWREAHAVRIVTTKFTRADTNSPEPTPLEPNIVPARGSLPLWTLGTHRVAWQFFGGKMQYKPAGWLGSDNASRTSVGVQTITRGDARPSINIHPPWSPEAGTAFCEWLVTLPDTRPLSVTFANAIRDSTPTEPPSDGVLFRVWAGTDPTGADSRVIYENFTDAKVWAPGEVDLSAFAGKTILLRLESHPGPNKNTTCDSSYWAQPTVVAGSPPAPRKVSFQQATDEAVQAGRRIVEGTLKADERFTFLLGEGDNAVAAVFTPSERGIVDGTLTLVSRRSSVSFDGFTLDILGQPAVRWPTSIEFLDYSTRTENGRAIHAHHLRKDGQEIDLNLTVYTEEDGLRIAWDCPERVTDFALGPCDRIAQVVYYGHGYAIRNPKAFRAVFGGHNLATSHVGCDFEGGLSLLQAVDVPPDHFDVNPDARRYALHTHMNGMLTLVAGETGAFDCAVRYRPIYDKPPAGGVQRLAGRFCFDIWGGRYADIADRMREMIRYGLTDSFLTVHAWQRWGYDYRLPDIWPPNPALGTIEDMRKIGQVCDPADIPWGLHDNYIDFYPDATGYTYDAICFTRGGEPIKAWINESREAQSYRWRPDSFMPFLARNLSLIKEGVSPSHYFIDVFTSAGCFDYYDREGNFHPSTETRQMWGEAFAYIRDFLGNNAPMTSEAGHDQLIGYLDGADAQHLALADKPDRFRIYAPCEDWQRVPWFDAVNHARFIQHGVGYSDRYQGGLDRINHGINSDDYISAEILTGHALMVDGRSWGRDAVRKYWLAQPVARHLALRAVRQVEFVDGDIHRMIVTWDSGTRVYVNRGERDWIVEGRTLPQYGYLVLGRDITCEMHRNAGVWQESTTAPGYWYCNARTDDPDRRARIEPRIENFRYLGGRRFSYDLVWEADEAAPRDMMAFVHFYSGASQRRDKIAFQDDHRPSPTTDKWSGEVRYTRVKEIPEDAESEYRFAVGLYDSKGRLSLRGPAGSETGGDSVLVGTLVVRRENGQVTGISLTPPPAAEPTEPSRFNSEGTKVDFGVTVTDGAFRLERAPDGFALTPLPDSRPFEASLSAAELGLPADGVTVWAVDDEGAETPRDASVRDGRLVLQHDGKAFQYRIRVP